ncbi:MAG: copper resistance protein CopC [Acidimicrobiia bacterium]
MGAGSRNVTFRLVAGVVFGLVLVLALPALAHSFLVETNPAQGTTLSQPPADIALQFTEPVVVNTAVVSVVTGDGAAISTGPSPEAEAGGSVLRLALPELDDVVLVVSWHVVSAVDGHEAAGEFAFAVGNTTAALAAATQSGGSGGWARLLRWLFLAGLTAAAGGLVTAESRQTDRTRLATWGRAGLILASLSATALYLRAVTGGLSVRVVGPGAAAALLALATIVTGRTRKGGIGLALTGAAAVAWATRSHTATSGGTLGVIADAAHLAGAALWLGTLAVLVVDLWRQGERDRLGQSARIYARWALRAVLVLAAAGLSSVLSLLTSISDLWTTPYGRVVALKVSLFLVAVALAATARRRALPSDNLGLLRRLTTVEATVLVAVVAVSGILAGMPPPALAQTEGETLLGPPPIEGAVARAAGLAGAMTIGVAVGDGRVDLLVYNESTGGIEDADIEAAALLPGGIAIELAPRPCGSGCFTQELSLPEGKTTFMVTATSQDWTAGTAQLNVSWPPPARQPELLAQVIDAMTAVEEFTLSETVRSGPGAEATSNTQISGEAFIALEVYAYGNIEEAIPLPGDPPGIRLYLPGSRILIDLHLDRHNRITTERIISPGHEIDRTFTYP